MTQTEHLCQRGESSQTNSCVDLNRKEAEVTTKSLLTINQINNKQNTQKQAGKGR